jgi:hypothetical protein
LVTDGRCEIIVQAVLINNSADSPGRFCGFFVFLSFFLLFFRPRIIVERMCGITSEPKQSMFTFSSSWHLSYLSSPNRLGK